MILNEARALSTRLNYLETNTLGYTIAQIFVLGVIEWAWSNKYEKVYGYCRKVDSCQISDLWSHMHCEPVWVEFELSHFYANETENSTQLTLHAN